MQPTLRKATKHDQPAIIDLIAAVYEEYGERMCLEGADADLLDLDKAYRQRGGEVIVAEQGGRIIGSHATLPVDVNAGVITYRRLYTASETRGSGLGDRLMQWAFEWSIEHGFKQVVFWSDTRFVRAHAFFTKLGFEKGETRDMNDGHEPYQEFRFAKVLVG